MFSGLSHGFLISFSFMNSHNFGILLPKLWRQTMLEQGHENTLLIMVWMGMGQFFKLEKVSETPETVEESGDSERHKEV